ncbi:MAG: hypothetical protein ACFE0I_21305 [Elainellaceae cyanobacterium]
MTASQTLKLTLDWRSAAADLPPEIQEQQTQNLYRALRQLPDIEKIERIADPDAPDGGMGAAWLKDLLFTEVTPSNLVKLFSVIRQRLPGTPINFEIEVDGQKKRVSMNGVRPEDFDTALDKLVKAANAMTSDQKSN